MPITLIPEDFIARARAAENWTLDNDAACEKTLEALERFGVTRIQYDGERLATSDPFVPATLESGRQSVFDALQTLPSKVAGVVNRQ